MFVLLGIMTFRIKIVNIYFPVINFIVEKGFVS